MVTASGQHIYSDGTLPTGQPQVDRNYASVDTVLMRNGVSIAIGLSIMVILAAVLLRPLIPIDETRYMTVAWEMSHTGDWLVPHLNGEPYSHKPPMLFWLINAAWKIAGSQNEFVARLVPATFLPLNIFLTFLLGSSIGSQKDASIAALILFGITAFCLFSSLVLFDQMLATASLLGVIGLVDAAKGKVWRGFLLFGSAIGFGLLAKGPAIFIHVLPAALLGPLWAPKETRWSTFYLSIFGAIALGASIGLLWAVPAARSGGAEYANMILWGQTAGRVVNSFDHAQPFWFYAVISPLLLFPWVLSRNVWAGAAARRSGSTKDRLQRLSWIVSLGSFVLFSAVSGKQIYYLVPALPFASLAIAQTLAKRREVQLSEPGFAIFFFLVGLTIFIFALLPHNVSKTTIAMNPWISGLFLAMAALAWLLRGNLFAVTTFTTCGLFLGAHLAGFVGAFGPFDLNWLGKQLREHPNAQVAYSGDYKGQIGFIGRLDHPVVVLDKSDADAWLRAHGNGILVASGHDSRRIVPERAPDQTQPYRGNEISIWLPTK
jgi:4-amino-4-deoxy-L-arabinose transferase-like glycosyltransferase